VANQNLINKLEIYRLVKDFFCLTKKSLSIFKYRLFYEPNVNPMYKKILGDTKNLRKKIPLSGNLLINFDEGWKTFRHFFDSFYRSTGITYKHFNENKVIYKNQEFKIKKALVDYYKNNLFNSIFDFSFDNNIQQFLHSKGQKINFGTRNFTKEDRIVFHEKNGKKIITITIFLVLMIGLQNYLFQNTYA